LNGSRFKKRGGKAVKRKKVHGFTLSEITLEKGAIR